MEEAFRFADELGPFKLVHIYRPSADLKAVVAIDNIGCGPAIGGVRMAPDVSTEEAFRLARAMTFKNAAAGLPHGGGKSVIFADPKMALRDKERLIRAFAAAIGNLAEYIPGPDMGTDELAMGWNQGPDRPRRRAAARDQWHPARRDRRHRFWSCQRNRCSAAPYRAAARRCASRDPGLRLGRQARRALPRRERGGARRRQ